MDRYEINAPHIVGEVIDGEAIIMDLKSGYYYSCVGTGALLWSAIECHCEIDTVKTALAERFPASAATINMDVDNFLSRLLQDDLIRQTSSSTPVAPIPEAITALSAYLSPELQSYTDMQDLLLLDPVHEVEEAGWPQAKS